MQRFKKAIISCLLILAGLTFSQPTQSAEGVSTKKPSPNFVVIFADDLGYGDLGVYGHPTIRTPHLDKMAAEGQKWTSFYVTAPVCTPSRAGLLTGRLPIRSGMTKVWFPKDTTGLPPQERTIASVLKENGYRTAAVGKWHLGHKSPYLPTDHGFDSYFGIPYSNDMKIDPEMDFADNVKWRKGMTRDKVKPRRGWVPLMHDKKVIEYPCDQETLTLRYTKEATKFIKKNRKHPFFLYLAHTMPHIPLYRSKKFKDTSLRGIYGDVIEELDWSVGEILKTLKEEGLAENTLVIFTSDNGPWQNDNINTHGGSAGLLKGAKFTTWEGGMREPAITWWPGKIKPGIIMDMASTTDLLPTFCHLSDTPLPKDRILDGYDITPLLFGTGKSRRNTVYYYKGKNLEAIRKGEYKCRFKKETQLYNVNTDPSEKYNIAGKHPDIVTQMRQLREKHLKETEKKEY